MARQTKKQHHRLNTIRSHPRLMHNMTFGVTTKSWRSKPAPCCPSNRLQLPLFDTSPETDITHFSIVFPQMWLHRGRYLRRGLSYWHPWTDLVGYSHDVVIGRGRPRPSEVYLWNPVESWYSSLPPWDCKVPFKRAVLNLPRADCRRSFDPAVMVVTGISRPAFVICNLCRGRLGEFKWIKYDCNVEDPNYGNSSERRMEFTNAVGANGKFYAPSLQGTLAVIECSDSGAEIVALCTSRAVPDF